MDSKTLQEAGYGYLIEKFGEQKIISRFDFLHDILDIYITENCLVGKVAININILEHIITDYFVDVDRLKEFQEIELTNQVKIYAYLSFWVLRHKPFQIIISDESEDLTFINERFVADLLRSFLFNNPKDVAVISEKRECVDEFSRTMEYFFCYREYSAKSIELVLLAFQAGRAYQYSVDYQK